MCTEEKLFTLWSEFQENLLRGQHSKLCLFYKNTGSINCPTLHMAAEPHFSISAQLKKTLSSECKCAHAGPHVVAALTSAPL